MENKKKLFSPIITTIPDDMLVFSILNINEKITHKFIMENYINFYSFKVLNEEYVVLRFEDTMNRKKYEGIDHCFIPIDLLEKYDQNFNIIIEMIREGYFLTLPICKKDISFYEELEGTHLITIYDADVSKNIFLCKDFQGHKFVEFEVPFKDIKNGLLNYHRIYQKDSEGLTALRLTNKCNTKIDYCSRIFVQIQRDLE